MGIYEAQQLSGMHCVIQASREQEAHPFKNRSLLRAPTGCVLELLAGFLHAFRNPIVTFIFFSKRSARFLSGFCIQAFGHPSQGMISPSCLLRIPGFRQTRGGQDPGSKSFSSGSVEVSRPKVTYNTVKHVRSLLLSLTLLACPLCDTRRSICEKSPYSRRQE